jgi:hypothetical protein
MYKLPDVDIIGGEGNLVEGNEDGEDVQASENYENNMGDENNEEMRKMRIC